MRTLALSNEARFGSTLPAEAIEAPSGSLTALDRLRAFVPHAQAQGLPVAGVARAIGVTRGRVYQLRDEGGLAWPPRRLLALNRLCPVCGRRIKASSRSGLCRAHWCAKRREEAQPANYRPNRARKQALRLVREMPNRGLPEALETLKALAVRHTNPRGTP